MNRFSAVLNLPHQRPSLLAIAQTFVAAIEEANAEDVVLVNDPAVILLGAHIAFQVNADVISTPTYQRLHLLCEEMAQDRQTQLSARH